MSHNLLRERLIDSLRKNIQVLGHILQPVTQPQSMTWRDGADGWTVLEVVCHLRDFDEIFLERGQLMLQNNHPTFPVYDHLVMVEERAYNEQNLLQVLGSFQQSREQFVRFFAGLTDEQWQRTGQHRTQGQYTMETLAAHVAWHDNNHLEQISRILSKR